MSDKPHYVQVFDPELSAIKAAGSGLEVPMLYKYSDHENAYYADAGELRAWRAGLAPTSGEAK
jgi:hypothetical protein